MASVLNKLLNRNIMKLNKRLVLASSFCNKWQSTAHAKCFI